MTLRSIATACALCLAVPVSAGELTFGVGQGFYHGEADLFDSADALQVELEVRSDPFARLAGSDLSYQAAILSNTTGSVWAGVGIGAQSRFGAHWVIQASLSAGYYHAGSRSADLGSDLEFRTTLDLGRELANGSRMSIGATHLSNAGIGSINPGLDAITLRLTQPF